MHLAAQGVTEPGARVCMFMSQVLKVHVLLGPKHRSGQLDYSGVAQHPQVLMKLYNTLCF
jgi:hypothetical protein